MSKKTTNVRFVLSEHILKSNYASMSGKIYQCHIQNGRFVLSPRTDFLKIGFLSTCLDTLFVHWLVLCMQLDMVESGVGPSLVPPIY